MGLAGDSMGTCSNALALVCVALALTNLEAVGEVEEIRDELSANPSEEAASYYNEIPGFSMIAGASEEKALNKQECQSKCSASAECASFSWKGADKTCIVSTKALSYDADYQLYTKATTSRKKGNYRRFDGLVYRSSGWAALLGKTKVECKDVCDSKTECEAFSYTIPDGDVDKSKCLLSGKAISYSEGFTYYEKKGVAAQSQTQEESDKVAASPAEQVSQDPNNQAVEIAEKAKVKAAMDEAKDAEKKEKDAQNKFDAEKGKLKAEFEEKTKQIKKDAAANAKKEEDKVSTDMEKQMENKMEKMKLQVATVELEKDKKDAEKLQEANQAAAEKEAEVMKQEAKLKADLLKKEGEAEVKTAEEKAALKSQTAQLATKEKELAAEKI